MHPTLLHTRSKQQTMLSCVLFALLFLRFALNTKQHNSNALWWKWRGPKGFCFTFVPHNWIFHFVWAFLKMVYSYTAHPHSVGMKIALGRHKSSPPPSPLQIWQFEQHAKQGIPGNPVESCNNIFLNEWPYYRKWFRLMSTPSRNVRRVILYNNNPVICVWIKKKWKKWTCAVLFFQAF